MEANISKNTLESIKDTLGNVLRDWDPSKDAVHWASGGIAPP